jgi:hypothetical protein
LQRHLIAEGIDSFNLLRRLRPLLRQSTPVKPEAMRQRRSGYPTSELTYNDRHWRPSYTDRRRRLPHRDGLKKKCDAKSDTSPACDAMNQHNGMDLDSPSSISPGLKIPECRRTGTSNRGAYTQPVEPPQPDPARTTTKDPSSVPAIKRRVWPLIDDLLHEQYKKILPHLTAQLHLEGIKWANTMLVRYGESEALAIPTVLIVAKSPGVALNIDLPEPLQLKWARFRSQSPERIWTY